MLAPGFFKENLADRGVRKTAELAASLQHELNNDAFLELLALARNWHVQGFWVEQRTICEMVLEALPEQYEALHLLGFQAQMHGDSLQAEQYYDRAAKSDPDYSFARLALAQMRMMRSEFKDGLDLYEARFDAVTEGSGPDWRGLPIARWRGEPLAGRKLYIWAEQGLGDVVMFAGFLPHLLAQKPARLVLGLFPKLQSLFARSFPSVVIEPIDDAVQLALAPAMLESFEQIEKLAGGMNLPFPIAPLKAAHAYARRHGLFDFAAPMGDVLVYGGVGFACKKAYLSADPLRVKRITAGLMEQLGRGRRIGISWATSNKNEWMRNAPLEAWLPVLEVPDCHFISLQHGEDRGHTQSFCAEHRCDIAHVAEVDLLSDAEGLAALIASMDEVITIDNANAHLAGALGVPTTLLLPKGHNYRWPVQVDRGTLWYDSVQTIRQENTFDWSAVMAEASVGLIQRRN